MSDIKNTEAKIVVKIVMIVIWDPVPIKTDIIKGKVGGLKTSSFSFFQLFSFEPDGLSIIPVPECWSGILALRALLKIIHIKSC